MPRTRRAPTTALIVDHHPESNWRTAEILSSMGFANLWRARSIRQALRICTVTPFDVAIIDLVLGKEDGGHLVSALRAWPGAVGKTIAVAVCGDLLRTAREAHLPADAFVRKPLQEHLLRPYIGMASKPPNGPVFGPSEIIELD